MEGSDSLSVQSVGKGRTEPPEIAWGSDISVASYMKLYNAAPPDRILTYFPEVTACRGRDLAPRVKQSPTKWRLTEVAHDQIQSFISKTRPCSGLRAIKDHRRRKIDTIYGPLRIHARRYEECSCGQPNAPFRVAGFFRIARPRIAAPAGQVWL